MDFIKLKSFCMARENISKMKREPTIWEMYLPMIPWTRVWSPKYRKNSYDSTPGRQTIQLKSGQRTWTDTSPRWHIRGTETCEKMLSITSHQKDANENHNEIPLQRLECYQKQINKPQVLERSWNKGNPSALLVGMQSGAVTVEMSMDFPWNTKNRSSFCSSKSTFGIIS